MPGSEPVKTPGSTAHKTDSRVGTVLAERYRLDSLLGEGGMGRVYSAEHVLMRKRLAVKVLHRELTSVPEVVARFEREAMAAANIEHPNVAAATDFGKLGDGAVFLVLEYVQGKNLRDEIAEGPMAVERALHIARQIASALSSAHGLDIVHRDLKPENVMLVDKGGDPDFVKVLDFGIAKVPIGEGADRDGSKPITKVGMVFGTPEYMAPEQALGQPVDGRADLYALGVILYEMFSGVRPFTSKSQVGILGQQLSKPVPSFAERSPGIIIPPSAEALVRRLLEREAADRYSTASELVDAINEVMGESGARGRMFTLTGGSPPSRSDPGVSSGPRSWPQQPPASAPSHPDPSSPALAPPSDPSLPVRISAAPYDLSPVSESPSVPDFNYGTSPGERATDSLPSFSLEGESKPESLRSPTPPKLAARTPRAADSLLVQLDPLLDWIDRKRETLPEQVRTPLADVPTLALLGGAALVALGVLTGTIVLLVSLVGGGGETTQVAGASTGGAEPVRVDAPKDAPGPEELARAKREGSKAFVSLVQRYPKNGALQLDLAEAYLLEKNYTEAVNAVGRALTLDPKLKDEKRTQMTLWSTAQSSESADAAFALLEGPMGAKGADIIYDLTIEKGMKTSVVKRTEAWLKTKEFDRQSSPQLAIAVDLRHAKNCEQRHGLLLRAKNVGDERTLPYLRQLENPAGCGPRGSRDCNPCLREDDRLQQAIAAVEKRKGSSK